MKVCVWTFQCLLATRPKNPATQRHNTARHRGGGNVGGVTAPNNYHMPIQLAPPSLLVYTLKKNMGGVERVGVCLRQGCGSGSSYGPDLPAAQTPARKRTYTKARSLNLCHHRSGKAWQWQREEVEKRQKKGSVERSDTQRETWTSWLGMGQGGTGRWAQDEPGWRYRLAHGDEEVMQKPISYRQTLLWNCASPL